MGPMHPTGVKIIIAFFSFSLAFDTGIALLLLQTGQLQGLFYINLLSPVIVAVTIIGLWRMKRWGLWLTIAMSALGLVGGGLNLVILMTQLHLLMELPMFWMLLNLMIFSISGPIQLIASSLIIIYLYKARKMFLSGFKKKLPENVILP